MSSSCRLVLVCIAASMCLSCAAKVRATRMEPARFPVRGIARLAVGEFGGGCARCERWGSVLADEVTEQLEGKAFYEIVAGKPVVGEREPAGADSLPEWRDWGRRHGADGIVGGTVHSIDIDRAWSTRQVREREYTGRYRTRVYEDNGKVKRRREEIVRDYVRYVPTVQVSVRVHAAAALYDVKSGERISVREYRDRSSRYLEGEFRVRDVAAADEMVVLLVRRIAGRIVDDLVPHQVSEKLKLAPDKEGAAGVKLARRGDWEGARRAWSAVVDVNPDNHTAFYNLGIAAEVGGDYAAAHAHYERALSLSDKGLYREALRRVLSRMEEQERLRLQLHGR